MISNTFLKLEDIYSNDTLISTAQAKPTSAIKSKKI